MSPSIPFVQADKENLCVSIQRGKIKFDGNWTTLLLVQSFLLQLATYTVRSATVYRALQVGVSPAYLGFLAASFAIIPLFASIIIGRAADAGHEAKILMFGSILMFLAGVGLLTSSSSMGLIFLWNIFLGMGHLMSVIGQQSKIAQRPSAKLDSAFGHYTLAGSAGQALAPIFIAFFGEGKIIPNTHALFLIYTCTVSISLIFSTLLFLQKRENPSSQIILPNEKIQASIRALSPVVRRHLFGAMLVSMMVTGAVDLIALYLPALGVKRGIPAATIGILLSVRAVASMISRVHLSRLVKKLGRSEVITYSTVLAAITVGCLVIPMPLPMTALALFLAGICLGIGQPLTMTVISITVPPGSRGMWLAVRLAANRFGQSAVPGAIGLLAASFGVSGVFFATSVSLALVSGAAVYTLPKDQK